MKPAMRYRTSRPDTRRRMNISRLVTRLTSVDLETVSQQMRDALADIEDSSAQTPEPAARPAPVAACQTGSRRQAHTQNHTSSTTKAGHGDTTPANSRTCARTTALDGR